MSEKRKYNVKKLRSIAVDDDKGDQTNQRISTSHHNDKAQKYNHYCEFYFTIVNLIGLISYVITQNKDHFKVEKC